MSNETNTNEMRTSSLLNDIKTAVKSYNEELRMWQYTAITGQVFITVKTEKGLDSAWKKYLKVWE